MQNANEIANKKFEKAMGRYRPEEVDAYLKQVSESVNELNAQNRDLEHKMLVLADKLEEYRQDEDSMRSALIGAQKLGDSVVREAKGKAAAIIADANDQAKQLIDNAQRAIEKEQNAFLRLQREVATFRSKLQLVYKQHLELISSIPVDQDFLTAAAAASAPPPEPVYEPPVPSVYEEDEPPMMQEDAYTEDLPPLDDSLEYSEQKLEYTTEDSFTPEPTRDAPKRESRFGPLKFGKDFEIRRDEDTKRKK